MKYVLTGLVFLTIFLSCEAPRENPFDPASPNFKEEKEHKAHTSLFVHSIYPPFIGIPHVKVGETNSAYFGITNVDGYVSWQHDPQDSLYFILQADGYFSDSVLFTGNGWTNNLQTALNAKPDFESIGMISIYQHLDAATQITYISISTKISDKDGLEDIQSVALKETAKSYSDTLLLADALKQEFELSRDIVEIDPELAPAQLPELNFFLVVKNQNGDSLVSAPFHVQRIIEKWIALTTPENSSTQQGSVVFSWEPVSLSFPFTYTLYIERLEDQAEFVYSNISSSETQFTVKNLTAGTYFWQLQVIDLLGNTCQSIFMSFKHV